MFSHLLQDEKMNKSIKLCCLTVGEKLTGSGKEALLKGGYQRFY